MVAYYLIDELFWTEEVNNAYLNWLQPLLSAYLITHSYHIFNGGLAKPMFRLRNGGVTPSHIEKCIDLSGELFMRWPEGYSKIAFALVHNSVTILMKFADISRSECSNWVMRQAI